MDNKDSFYWDAHTEEFKGRNGMYEPWVVMEEVDMCDYCVTCEPIHPLCKGCDMNKECGK